jgi:drug/metabolite transporter (DMT)-like permease
MMGSFGDPLTQTVQASAPAARPLVPVLMVFGCTIIGAVAQVFFKLGSALLPSRWDASAIPVLLGNAPLIAGLSLYGINTILMVLALRKGELSLLYPIISLTYVWVTAISVVLFNEQINLPKLAGLFLIVVGVAVLGLRGGRAS